MISRRKLLKAAGVVSAVEALGVSRFPAVSQAVSSGAKPRAIALIGDAAHNADYIRVSLNRIFSELNLPIEYTTNYYDLSASMLAPYQLFICFRDNRDDMIQPGTFGEQGAHTSPQADPRSGAPSAGRGPMPAMTALERRNGGRGEAWISEEQGRAVKEFVSAGNGFYSYHNNAFVSRSSTAYREVQGGIGLNHPPLRPYKVRIVNRNHPITHDVNDFMVDDEQHYLVYDKDPGNVLLHSENIDGLTFTPPIKDPNDLSNDPPKNLGTTSVSGWAHDYGKGRVVYTAMGHTIHVMWNPEYMKMQKNAIRWLLKQD